MSSRFHTGIAAVLMLLLALQAPLALALSCAGHGAAGNQAATATQLSGFVGADMLGSEASGEPCHGTTSMAPVADSALAREATQSADRKIGNSDDCCDDCACPAATGYALVATPVSAAQASAPLPIPEATLVFVSNPSDRILHPPIS